MAKNALFVYGTLKDSQVQLAVFGRCIPGEPDSLVGYRLTTIELDSKSYPLIENHPSSCVAGLRLLVSQPELKAIDSYETNAYQRIWVTLTSGHQAWVYVASP